MLVDDCTKMLWVSMLKQNSEAFKAFKNIKIQAEKEKDLKIYCLRTNNGGEFTSNEFSSFCIEHGIKRQYSTAYSPQKNGVIERKNKIVLDMTLTMSKNKNLPKTL